MKRILYHGSDPIVDNPLYGYGKVDNDYGLGFYCCSKKSLAEEWASKHEDIPGIVNKYEIIDDNLRILDLTKPPYDDPFYWVAILMHFKRLPAKLISQCSRELQYLECKYYIDINQYDVVIGYRADDNYFQFPQALLRSEILISTLKEVFMLGELGTQYVLISKKAFSKIKFLESFDSNLDYKTYRVRKDKADISYKEILERDRYKTGIRMIDLVKDK